MLCTIDGGPLDCTWLETGSFSGYLHEPCADAYDENAELDEAIDDVSGYDAELVFEAGRILFDGTTDSPNPAPDPIEARELFDDEEAAFPATFTPLVMVTG